MRPSTEAINNTMKACAVRARLASSFELAMLNSTPIESLDVLIGSIPEYFLEFMRDNTHYSNLAYTVFIREHYCKIVFQQVRTLRRGLGEVQPVVKSKPKKVFDNTLWCTSAGAKMSPADMETKHIYSTIRLLWNSYMPRPLSVGTYKAVWFNPELYTAEYLSAIIPALYSELLTRDNLLASHKAELANMQLDKLLAQTATQELVEQAVKEFEAREDKEYTKDNAYTSWDAKEGLDFS